MLKKGCMTKKELFIDYFLSLLIEMVILFGLMGFCALFIYKGDLLGDPVLVGSEMSSPTVGRLIYFILAFVLALGLCIAASILAQKGKETVAFWLGFTSGILLWQSFGEEAWHFSVGGNHFVQLEGITAFPLVLLFVALIVYGYKNRSFDWGVWSMIISFACNWLGHYITVGIYPFVSSFIESHTWNVWAGSIGGGVMFVLSILYLLSHADTKKGRMFASVLTYIAIGIVSLSLLDG